MILTDPHGNKLLVQSQGHITVNIEPDVKRPTRVAPLRPTLPILGAAVVASCLVSTVTAVFITWHIRDAVEARLTDRLERLSTHLDTALAAVGDDVVSQSDKVSAEVVRVGQRVAQVGERVDVIPAKFDAAAHGTTDAVIAWLSSLRKSAASPPLVVHAGDGKRK